MKLFGPLYDRVMTWSRHPHAERYLGVISFAESSFFPVPTAFMLAPMVMAKPDRAWWLAILATVTSVLGGLFGYLIGYLFFEQLGQPIIDFYNAGEKFAAIKGWFAEYGVALVLLAGVSPIPYKIITIASGVMGLPVILFTLASVLGRASQFFLVAGLLKWGGPKIEPVLKRWMELIGWGLILLAVMAYLLLR